MANKTGNYLNINIKTNLTDLLVRSNQKLLKNHLLSLKYIFFKWTIKLLGWGGCQTLSGKFNRIFSPSLMTFKFEITAPHQQKKAYNNIITKRLIFGNKVLVHLAGSLGCPIYLVCLAGSSNWNVKVHFQCKVLL